MGNRLAGDYFRKSKPLFAMVDFLFEPVWIDRSAEDRNHERFESIKAVLKRGHNLVIFPEGSRGRPGIIERFKTGIGRLAQRFPEIPVVPLYLCGAEKAFPKGSGCNLSPAQRPMNISIAGAFPTPLLQPVLHCG